MAKLVIVDGDASFAESVNHLMQPLGFRTVVTGDGDAAVDLIKTERPDLLMVAVELQKGSGFSLCNRLKRTADTSAIPIILLSSQATPEAFAQHQKLATRANAYLHKPFELPVLLQEAQQLSPQSFVRNGAAGDAGAGGDDVLSVQERSGDASPDALDRSLDQAFGKPPSRPGASQSALPFLASGSPTTNPGGPPPMPRAGTVRPGRSARGPSLDELLRSGKADEPNATLPPTAGPEAKQQFLRDTLRRREAELARARELWAAREREVQAMEDALDLRTRDLDTTRDELRDALVRLSTLDETTAAATAENAIMEERVSRMERERDALLQDGENMRDASERALQQADERLQNVVGQKEREAAELESLVAERVADIAALQARAEEARVAGEQAAQTAHEREMQLRGEKDALRTQWEEEVGTREGVQTLLRTETEQRVKAQGQFMDLTRAKEEGDKAATKTQKELQEKVVGLVKARAELEGERDTHLTELAQRADQLARMETRGADLEAALTEEQGKVTDLERALSERHHQIEELQEELNARAARIQGLESDLDRATQRISTLDAQVAALRDAAEKDARERSETERALRETLSSTETALKERELRIQTLGSDVARLQAALEASRAERDGLAERLGGVEAGLAEEQRNHVATREKGEAALTREKRAATEQKNVSDKRSGEQQARILTLETELAQSTESSHAFEADLTQTRTRLGDAERNLRSTRATLDETSAEREQLKGQLADYQGQLRRKTENEQRLNTELGASQARVGELEHEVESLRDQFGAEKGELDAARTRLEERARAKLAELSESLADTRSQADDLKSQAEGHQVHAQALENELLTLRAERDSEARSRVDAETRVEQLSRSLTEEKDKRDRSERDRLAVRKTLEKLEKTKEGVQGDLASAEAKHKLDQDALRGELRAKERALTEMQEAASRDKAAREREKQGLTRTLEDEKRVLNGKVEELTRRLERSETRATAAESEAAAERTTRVKERASAKVEKDALQTHLEALEAQAAQGGGGATMLELEKLSKEKDEHIEELEGERDMIAATLQDAANKNKRLQEEMARKTVGGAEAADLRKKYNEVVTRYKQKEEERKKLAEDYQKALEQLGKLKGGIQTVAPRPPPLPKV